MSEDADPAVDVEEVFRLLGNETRMGIMRTLWDRFVFSQYVVEDRNPTSFVTLREAVGVEDSGNFNYHLDQLTGTLVETDDEGYVLTPLGYNLMRAIDRYRDFEYATRDEWQVTESCPFCEGQLVAEYRREILSVRCADCGGLASNGNFTFVELPALGTRDLSNWDLLDVATLAMLAKIRASKHGFCWDCHARMRTEIRWCESHTRVADGTCPECANRFAAHVDADCDTCGTSGHGPVVEYGLLDPTVVELFARRGSGPETVGPWQYRLAAFESVEERGAETDPLVVDVGFDVDGGSRRVSVRAGDDGIETDRRRD